MANHGTERLAAGDHPTYAGKGEGSRGPRNLRRPLWRNAPEKLQTKGPPADARSAAPERPVVHGELNGSLRGVAAAARPKTRSRPAWAA